MSARVSALLGLVAALSPAGALAQGFRIDHDGVGCVVAGRFPRLAAQIEPASAVGRARVHFRAEGSSAWYFVEMRVVDRAWTGVLPKPNASLSRFSYYVEATGTSFEGARTREFTPRVVKDQGECEARTLVAAVSAIGPAFVGAPSGAPATPLGFAPLHPAAGVAGAASGGGVTGSGISNGLVLGLAGGALALGGAAALVKGGQDDAASAAPSPAATGPGTGAPAAGGPARLPQSLILALSDNCTLYGGVALYAGDKVTIGRGMCDWTSRSDAQAACAGQSATIAVDGRPLTGLRYDIGYAGANGLYCSAAEADWTAVAGAHVAAGSWTLPGSPLHSCAMTVQP